jgi:F-type H+-transporting ATPase subunit alpha
VQIYAATNGYLDRIVVDKVERFLGELTEHVRGNEPDLLKKIADGDWGDDTESQVEQAVQQFAEDFGFDLDEEGHPLEEDGDDEPRSRQDSNGSSDESEASDGGSEESGEREEAAQPA